MAEHLHPPGDHEHRPALEPPPDDHFWAEVINLSSRYVATLRWVGVDHEDVAQQTALKLVRASRLGKVELNGGRVPRALVRRIAHNAAVDEARRAGVRARRAHPDGFEAAERAATTESSPEHAIEAREELRALSAEIPSWRRHVERTRGPEAELLCGLLLEGSTPYAQVVDAVRRRYPDTSLTPNGLRQAVLRWRRKFPILFARLERRRTKDVARAVEPARDIDGGSS